MPEEYIATVNKVIEEADIVRLALLASVKKLDTIKTASNSEYIAINTAKVKFNLATSKMEQAIRELEAIGG